MSDPANEKIICRTCLTTRRPVISIFNVVITGNVVSRICDVVSMCASVQISPGDELPDHICTQCVNELKQAFLFKKKCEKADTELRDAMKLSTVKYFILKDCSDLGDSNKKDLVEVVDLNPESPESETRIIDYVIKPEDVKKPNILKRAKIAVDIAEKAVDKTEEAVDKTEKSTPLFTISQLTAGQAKTLKCGKSQLINFANNRRVQGLNKVKLKPHRNNSLGPRNCSLCKKQFGSNADLRAHLRMHSNDKPYLCDICGKCYTTKFSIELHLRHHSGERPFVCSICNLSFRYPSTLTKHKTTHRKEKLFKCGVCKKSFVSIANLKCHSRVHSEARPYECKLCSKRFKRHGSLSTHMKAHTGEKPHECKECGKCFGTKRILMFHMRTHTGEKPYVCELCGRAFSQASSMNTHKKLLHKSEN